MANQNNAKYKKLGSVRIILPESRRVCASCLFRALASRVLLREVKSRCPVLFAEMTATSGALRVRMTRGCVSMT